jgi:uncharacterized membrane protein YbhN (UPF0104 family)
MKSSVWNRASGLFGLLLQVCAFIFLGVVLYKNLDRLRSTLQLRSDLWLLLTGLTLASVAMVAMLVLGWRALLRGAGATAASFRNVFWVIGRTAIAKYIPGNIFQYVGRQMFTKALGAEPVTILAGTLGEILIVASVSCLIAAVSLPFALLPAVPPLTRALALAVMAVGACSPGVFWLAGPWLARYRLFSFLRPVLNIRAPAWTQSFLGYGVCLLLGVAIFVVAAVFFVGALKPGDVHTLVAAYGVSYAFGFMMPGAPGGLGVREALIVLIASAHIDQSSLVAAAIAQRACSIFAETLCYGTTFFTSMSGPTARSETVRPSPASQ